MSTNDATNVKIKLISSITPIDGERETYEMWLQGSYIVKAGTPYLRYEEMQEDQTIHTTIKIAGTKSLIIRSGAVKMRLPLNKEQRESGHYENAFGMIPIETSTRSLEHDHALNNGRFAANYDLLVDGNNVGNYKLEIEYQEVQS